MARIRTIKPEFWQNPELAGLPDRTRLLAIALLNHSDDEGYFKANASLVRSACFPFDDDSLSIHGGLTELSNIGYIEIRKPAEGKEIGRVCKFLEHQKINRASPSKLAPLFNSVNAQLRNRERSPRPKRICNSHSKSTPRAFWTLTTSTAAKVAKRSHSSVWRTRSPQLIDLLGVVTDGRNKATIRNCDFGIA